MKKSLAFVFYAVVILFFPAAILAYTFVPALAPLISFGAFFKTGLLFVIGATMLAILLKRGDPTQVLSFIGPFGFVEPPQFGEVMLDGRTVTAKDDVVVEGEVLD